MADLKQSSLHESLGMVVTSEGKQVGDTEDGWEQFSDDKEEIKAENGAKDPPDANMDRRSVGSQSHTQDAGTQEGCPKQVAFYDATEINEQKGPACYKPAMSLPTCQVFLTPEESAQADEKTANKEIKQEEQENANEMEWQNNATLAEATAMNAGSSTFHLPNCTQHPGTRFTNCWKHVMC